MKKLRVVIPKGRIHRKVVDILAEAGIRLDIDERGYRPFVSDNEISVKIMKPQNIPTLLELGSHDIGFTGIDWVTETGADVATVMKLGFDPVRIVAAIPEEVDEKELKKRKIVVASEYETICKAWLDKQGYDYVFLRTHGATEVFPPDDADMIVDNSSTGRTLVENKLKVIGEVLSSSTHLIANHAVLEDDWKRAKVERIQMLFQSILDARVRVMLEMNVPKEQLEEVIRILPCMRAPTVSPLYNDEGYSVKAAVKKIDAANLIPKLKALGARDILEYDFRKVVA
ncbi:MAG: ATP phosphoribosyltransferase [Calditrichia bacterium]